VATAFLPFTELATFGRLGFTFFDSSSGRFDTDALTAAAAFSRPVPHADDLSDSLPNCAVQGKVSLTLVYTLNLHHARR